MKVFLDGTANGSTWREAVIGKLKIEHYDPEAEQWNEETFRRKIKEKDDAEYCFYVITPKMTDFYSIVEVVDDSNKRSTKTLYCFLPEDEGEEFTNHQKKSLVAVGKMVKHNGGQWFETLDEACDFLNSKTKIA